MTGFLFGSINTDASIGKLIQIESGGFLEEFGVQKTVEVPSIKNAHCVPRALALSVSNGYRYREEVKFVTQFGERPIRIPYLIQGEECYLLIQVKKMADLERRRHVVNEWMDTIESSDSDFKLIILHPGFPDEYLVKWEQLWPIEHVNIPYGVI